jgi:perosamine synthetase
MEPLIPIHTTYIHSSAKEIISNIIDTTWLSEGSKVKEFENKLSKELGIINPIAVNSGTSALHLSMVLAGIKQGDEVICPAQTFVASALVIVQQGAIPIFADINYNTGNIDPKSIAEKISAKTKAILVVHWGGMPCDMDEIEIIAKEHGLIIIEDAAHAPGAIYKGKFVGSISDYTCFSFQAIKHITTGDGGAIACKNFEKAQEAVIRRWFGIDRANSVASIVGERQYDITLQGFKYHLNDYGAALGLANISDISQRLLWLREIAQYYRQQLQNVPGLKLWDCPADRESAWWLFGMHVEKRIDFINAMADRGITASVVHQGIDTKSIFGGKDENLVSQRKFDLSQIHIPLHNGLSKEKINHIIDSIKKGW